MFQFRRFPSYTYGFSVCLLYTSIGTGFIDHAHHAQGHPHLGNDQSIGQGLGVEHFSDGVLEGSHLAYSFHNASQTLFVQEHPVEQVGGDAGSPAGGNIFRIGGKDFRGVFFQGARLVKANTT